MIAAVTRTVDLMRDNNIGLDTTAVILERLMLSRARTVHDGDAPYLSHMPVSYQRNRKRTYVPFSTQADLDAYSESFEVLLKVMKMLHDNGIALWPGTDDGTGFTVHRELELYVKAGLEKDKAALLIVMAALSDGRKTVLSVTAGHRESTVSWSEILRDLRQRGLKKPPRVIVGDGNHLAMESTLAEALQVVFGERPPAAKSTTEAPQVPISGASEALSRADEALRRGDWGAFGREWERLKSLLEK